MVSDEGGCWFLWMNSYEGDLSSGQYNFDYDEWTDLFYDFGFCLIGCDNNINETKLIPTKVDMLTNYPNPFNVQTTIQFSLQESGNVSIQIHDLLGRCVDNINAGYLQNSQVYTINYDAGEISTGMYFYSLIVNGKNKITQKFNLLK